MITCPNCGSPVRETQQFCGNCGTDVHAALAAAPVPTTAGEEDATSPYAYTEPAGYTGDYQQPLRSANSRLIIIGATVLLLACCMFACGFINGFEIIPDILSALGGGAPKVTPTSTPAGWLPIIHYLIG